jgi:hypothetical protein
LEKDINDDKSCVLDWLEHGVDVNKFFRHFKGNFKGRNFDSDIPHKQAGLSLTVTVVGSKPHFNSHSGIFTNDA